MKYGISVGLVIAAVIWHIAIFRLSPKLKLIKLNFNKQPIMASYGIVSFVYITAIAGALTVLGYSDARHTALYLGVMGAMWVLGILDDMLGSREVGGFKGHFKKLFFERKLTTGAVKAIGGGLVSLTAGWFISGGDPIRWALAFLVIALATNTLNLLDLRPGRAVAVFFFGLGVTYILVRGSMAAPWIVGTIAVVTFIFAVIDSRGLAMMGDSGSNAIGAALGLSIALNTGLIAQLIAITFFAAIHIYSEKHSISALIERNRVLKCIDRRLGVR